MNDDRKMYDNDGQGWECVECGGRIEKLPFQPRDGSNLRCFDCHKNGGGNGGSAQKRERKMYDNDGNGWTCSDCGNKIDELPFEPHDTSNLKCRDCFRK
jgi:CxxC-x17-CxxC domain-containing protein